MHHYFKSSLNWRKIKVFYKNIYKTGFRICKCKSCNSVYGGKYDLDKDKTGLQVEMCQFL